MKRCTRFGFTAFIAVTTLASVAAAGRVNPVDSQTIIDANGELVGHVQEARSNSHTIGGNLEAYPTLLFEIDEEMVALHVGPDGFHGEFRVSSYLYYLDAGCGGTPYLMSGTGPAMFWRWGLVGTPGQTLYHHAGEAPEQREMKSHRRDDGTCRNKEDYLSSREAVPGLDLTEIYALPFKMVPGCANRCSVPTIKISTESETKLAGDR